MDFIFRIFTTFSCLFYLTILVYQSPAQGELTDHGGGDLLIAEDSTLYGEHININNFVISALSTLSVSHYDPTTTMTGRLIIHANTIVIEGVIQASGVGYTGGGGGQGGGFTGDVGNGRYPGFDGNYGSGSLGDGMAVSFGEGGYNVPRLNTDESTDDSLLMGSGGLGGSGGSSDGAGAGGGGGGGGCGGGFVQLYAEHRLVLSGKVLTNGVLGQNGGDGDASTGRCFPNPNYPWMTEYIAGVGGIGGNAWPPGDGLGGYGDSNLGCDSVGSRGGGGWSGAGGGVLLKCESFNGLNITGEINALGGGPIDSELNGGSLKIFSPSPVFLGGADIKVGRLYVDAPPLQQVGWELY